MSYAIAIDRATWLSIAVPRVDICRADLELERRSDAVEHLAAVGLVGLLVGMEIDETRRDDQAGRVELLAAGERAFGDRRNLSTSDAEAADSIEPGFRIEDPSSRNHEVEVLCCQQRDSSEGEPEQSKREKNSFHR